MKKPQFEVFLPEHDGESRIADSSRSCLVINGVEIEMVSSLKVEAILAVGDIRRSKITIELAEDIPVTRFVPEPNNGSEK